MTDNLDSPERYRAHGNGKWCAKCSGLSHRRLRPCCPVCLEDFSPESIERTEPRNQSPVADFAGW